MRRDVSGLSADILFVADAHLSLLHPEWKSYSTWLARQSTADPAAAVDPNAVANIIYSSGTTGTPKGIAHTQLGRLDWAYDLALALRYHSGARTLLTLGLYSNISWVMMLCTLLSGGTLILEPKFDAEQFALRAIAKYGVTHTAMVPVQYRRLLACPDLGVLDLSSVQSLMSCGSALPADLKADLLETFRGSVIELYGLTEGVITTLDPEDAIDHLSSVGKPVQGTDIRLIDEDGHEVAQGEPGEIVGLCRFTMQGYWNCLIATAETSWLDESVALGFAPAISDELDADGFLYIIDRKKDMILSGGQTRSCRYRIRTTCASRRRRVRRCRCSTPQWGETPLAVVVPSTGDLNLKELKDWVNARVGRQQRVNSIVLVEGLRRNPNGKVLNGNCAKHSTADLPPDLLRIAPPASGCEDAGGDRGMASNKRKIKPRTGGDIPGLGQSNAAPGPRKRGRVSATRERILDAGEEFFAEHGFDGVTVRDITRKAKVDVALAHYDFGTMRGLFDAGFLRRAAILNEERLKVIDAYQIDRVRKARRSRDLSRRFSIR